MPLLPIQRKRHMPRKGSQKVQEATAVVEVKAVEPVAVAEPKKEKAVKKGGAKAAPAVEQAAPVVEQNTAAPAQVELAPAAKSAKKGGAKKDATAVEAAPVVADVAKVEEAKQEGGGEEEVVADGKRRVRYFKLVMGDGEPRGRFSGVKPKQAAAKALTSLVKESRQQGGSGYEEYKYTMVECTRGGRHKKYQYVGKQVKIENPVEVQQGGKTITYKHTNRVKKDKHQEA